MLDTEEKIYENTYNNSGEVIGRKMTSQAKIEEEISFCEQLDKLTIDIIRHNKIGLKRSLGFFKKFEKLVPIVFKRIGEKNIQVLEFGSSVSQTNLPTSEIKIIARLDKLSPFKIHKFMNILGQEFGYSIYEAKSIGEGKTQEYHLKIIEENQPLISILVCGNESYGNYIEKRRYYQKFSQKYRNFKFVVRILKLFSKCFLKKAAFQNFINGWLYECLAVQQLSQVDAVKLRNSNYLEKIKASLENIKQHKQITSIIFWLMSCVEYLSNIPYEKYIIFDYCKMKYQYQFNNKEQWKFFRSKFRVFLRAIKSNTKFGMKIKTLYQIERNDRELFRTIASKLQLDNYFFALNKEEVIVKEKSITKEEAKRILRLNNGDIKRSIKYIEENSKLITEENEFFLNYKKN